MNKTYAFTDLHGMYSLWKQIKEYCDETDTLIFLGDACDRGEDGIKIIKELLQDKRVIYLKGNHEKFLEDFGGDVMCGFLQSAYLWRGNGGFPTIKDFEKISDENTQLWFLRKISQLPLKMEYVNKKGQKILLSHAGYTPTLEPTNSEDFLWDREHCYQSWWPIEEEHKNTYVVHGHTPTYYLKRLIFSMGNDFIQETEKSPIIYCQGHKIGLDLASFESKAVILFDLDELKVEKVFTTK